MVLIFQEDWYQGGTRRDILGPKETRVTAQWFTHRTDDLYDLYDLFPLQFII